MEDEHHQVGGWGYGIETRKPALNLFFSLTTNTNCLQENLIIFLCLSSLSLNGDLYVPSLSSSVQLLRFQLYIKLSKWQHQQEGVFFHKKDTGSTKDVLVVITRSGVRLLLAKLSWGLRTTGLQDTPAYSCLTDAGILQNIFNITIITRIC